MSELHTQTHRFHLLDTLENRFSSTLVKLVSGCVALYRIQWLAVVNKVVKIRVPHIMGDFLTTRATIISF
jgi:hypothetical protein